ncbi:hypothetical protein SARC_01265 [Sphaeroforma arctica JP610]|uniref:Uncharacterized protein n=1 Tax=Sphaeroforma arctica JP610 TaxID=667725 RepID=A0A0L0GCG0_9EUKA|nr:hypothetical protein SARC_01265 [Sphaeroforma arctica JP610]KNC86584.1 hypothetical protein SARC_01265 [Sphaeroforma arctica JP610]|eukprot:XP_014160486.1 hypothetical protein SARC_01265 [Sphaeroforma arctica JP610]
MLLIALVVHLNFQVQLVSPVYLQGFGGDSQTTLNRQVSATLLLNVRAPNGTPTLYETKTIDFFVSDWLPWDCEALLGFDHLQDNLIGISWNQATSPPHFQLELPKVKYPVGFLIPQAPEQLTRMDLPPAYGPQSRMNTISDTWRSSQRYSIRARVSCKPSKISLMKHVKLRPKKGAQPVRQIYRTRDPVLQAVETAKMNQSYLDGKAAEGDKYSQWVSSVKIVQKNSKVTPTCCRVCD